ncbi:hypothetical protein ACFS2C_03995 [Prauserella oleivorans]|uniref:Uncharacterized protein n=1 Tax=Prauserella oleivorans TaxID=1478153 RepID=A0ABW5W7R3_9PSEU
MRSRSPHLEGIDVVVLECRSRADVEHRGRAGEGEQPAAELLRELGCPPDGMPPPEFEVSDVELHVVDAAATRIACRDSPGDAPTPRRVRRVWHFSWFTTSMLRPGPVPAATATGAAALHLLVHRGRHEPHR